jgi:4-hydroxy-3-polyprenylbenzoate decarboxylase
MHDSRRLIIGISGASGIILGVHALQPLRGLGITTHLVMSKSAEVTLAYETDLNPPTKAIASKYHPVSDIDMAQIRERMVS